MNSEDGISYSCNWLLKLTSSRTKNINLEILRGFPVPVPPLDLQKYFERRCLDISSIQMQQAAATAKAKATFNALLASFFPQTLTERMAV